MKVKDNYKNDGCQEIEQIQDSFLKYCIIVSKHCRNVISRAELRKFPLQFKVQAQMVKYFLRIAQGTGNKLLDETFASSQETNSSWTQNVERVLKSNGFANVLTNTCTVNKDTFHRNFLNRLKDMYFKILGIPPHLKLKITPNYILILIGTSSRTTWKKYKTLNIENPSLNCVLVTTVSSWKRVDIKPDQGKSDFVLFVTLR